MSRGGGEKDNVDFKVGDIISDSKRQLQYKMIFKRQFVFQKLLYISAQIW